MSGGSVRLTLRSSPPLVLYELGEYRCPPGCDGHYHHSWGSACVDLHVYTDGPSLGYVHPSAWCAAPHSSSFPPTTAPLQTLHMDVWGPTHISGQDRECYFQLVVDDYTRYTMVFPLRSKGGVPDVLIPWIRVVRLQLHERFREDLPILRLHSDRGGEFSLYLLQDFCRGEGILQLFTLPASPQQNGIAEHRIGLVMEVARTSMIHAAAPHFLWLFAVRYTAHQLNILPHVSLPETSPTLRWTGKVGDASVFRVWGSRAFVRDTSVDNLSSRAIPCILLGSPPDALGWQFYHPTSPLRTSRLTSRPPVDPLPPQGPAPSGVSQVDPLPGTVPVEVAVGSGAARGAASGGAEPGGAEPRAGASPRLCTRREPLSPQQLCKWFAQRTRLRSGAVGARGSPAGGTGAEGAGATSLGGAGVTAGAGGTGGVGAAGSGGARTIGTGAARAGGVGGARAGDPGAGGTGTGGAGARGAGAGDPSIGGAGARGSGAGGAGAEGSGAGGAGDGGAGAGGTGAVDPGARGTGAGDPGAGGAGAGGASAGGTGAGGTVQQRPFFVPPQPSSLLPPESVLRQPESPLPAPSPYVEHTDSFT
ncbi:unnamed protein product [Closterium sp. NIES-54]